MSPFHPLLGLLIAAQPVAERAPVVLNSHFYVEDMRDPANPVRRESDRVPLRPVQVCYRWELEVSPEDRTIAVREVFELPQAAPQWGIDPSGAEVTAVSRDRVSAVTEFQASLSEGRIGHGWCVAQGDPAGTHHIRAYAGDHLLHSFTFMVEPDTY